MTKRKTHIETCIYEQSDSICDIIDDPKFIRLQQQQWGVTMTDKEKMF